MKLIINIDGGSRGNPGEAALGVAFSDEEGHVLKAYSKSLGVATNNEAEYQALIFGLKKAKAVFGKEKIKDTAIEVQSDSELLVKQMRGEYKILEPSIQALFLTAWNLKVELKNVRFMAVPREANKLADRLVNEALDSSSKKQALF
ncbi:MAG: ribonuclease HI family protein [Candidatus Pacebacteria bacterium]|nr:ribonuclease HI family protein [Candidatus Paceibacterota bacterium]